MVVTTPHSLLRLLQYQSLLFLRLCHLLLDEVEVLLSEANEQVSVPRSFRCRYYLEIFTYMYIYREREKIETLLEIRKFSWEEAG